MSLHLVLRLIHVLAAIVSVGANLTYAFWLRRAGTDRDRIAYTIAAVRRLDRTFANPGYLVLLLTGLAMTATGGFGLDRGWIVGGLALYVLTALLGFTLFAPAIRRQLAEAERDPTGPGYAAAARRSQLLAGVTTALVLAIVVLMVLKPF